MTSSALIGTTEACDLLGVDRSTLSRWSDRRLLPQERKITPAYRGAGKNGVLLWSLADVEALAARLMTEKDAS